MKVFVWWILFSFHFQADSMAGTPGRDPCIGEESNVSTPGPALASYCLDVDSVWALSSALSAFDFRAGYHYVSVKGMFNCNESDFVKKSTLGVCYQSVTLVKDSWFPLKLFFCGLNAYDFVRVVLLPALKGTTEKRRSFFQNGICTLRRSPFKYLKGFRLQLLKLHTDDFDLLEDNLIRHMAHEFPLASLKFGYYTNGLRGTLEVITDELKLLLTQDQLELLTIHQGAEFTLGGIGCVSLDPDFDLTGCTVYEYMASNVLHGFTCDMKTGKPLSLSLGLGARTTYMQAYYPTAKYPDQKHANMAITLGVMYGMSEGNSLLDRISREAKATYFRYLAAVISFQAPCIPFWLEAVMEWRDDQPISAMDRLLCSAPMKRVVVNAHELDAMCEYRGEHLVFYMNSIAFMCQHLEPFVLQPNWPLSRDDFQMVSGIEAVMKACIQGSTQYVNYRTMIEALGGKRLKEVVAEFGVVRLPDLIVIDDSTLLSDLSRSEREHASVVSMWLHLLKGRVSGRQFASLLLNAIAGECPTFALTERAVLESAGCLIDGNCRVEDVIRMLWCSGSATPMRSFISQLAPFFWQFVDSTVDLGEFQADLLHSLKVHGDVFPKLMPKSKDKDRYNHFMRLVYDEESEMRALGLHFMEKQLDTYPSKLSALKADHPSVILSMKLAREFSDGTLFGRTKWAGWMLLLLLCWWAERTGCAYPYFSWSLWHAKLGWGAFGVPLERHSFLEELSDEARQALGNQRIVLGRFRLSPRYIQLAKVMVQRIEGVKGVDMSSDEKVSDIRPVRRKRKRDIWGYEVFEMFRQSL